MKAATLRVFHAALLREAHRLTSHPGLCWQQMHNRLQWEGPEVFEQLQPQAARRTAPASVPWIRTRMPFRESGLLMRTLAGHAGTVNACGVGSDGRTVVSAGDDYSLKVWDLATGQIRHTLTGSRGPATACALAADAGFVVGADLTGAIGLWNLATGELQSVIETGDTAVYACDLSIDNHLLATACEGGQLRVWDLDARRLTAELPGHDKNAYDCRFMPDRQHLISVGEDGLLKLWKLADRSLVQVLKPKSWHSLRSCAIGQSGRLVAALNDRAAMTVWEIESQKVVCEVWKDAQHHPFYWAAPGRSGVLGCCLLPGDSLAVSAAYDRTLTVWEIASGREVASLEGHTGWVRSVAASRDGRFVVSAGSDQILIVWDLDKLDEPGAGRVGKRYQPVKGCAFTPDGQRAASTCEDKSVTVWNVDHNSETATFIGQHYNDFLACAIDPDGRVIVTTSTDNTLAVRTIDGGHKVAQLVGHDILEYPYLGVFSCAFSRGGQVLVSAGGDKTVKVWDASRWTNTGTLEGHSDRVFGCAVSPCGTRIVSAGFDSTVRVWDLETRSERLTLRGHKGPAYCCAVSPDARWILSGGGGGTISKDFRLRLWDLQTGKVTGVLTGHSAPVRACGFSPDGAFGVSASEDGTLKVWNLETRLDVATVFLSGKAYCVDLHPWRPIVGCGDHGGNFYLLDLAGVQYGPIMLTACDVGRGPGWRCPRCRRAFPFDRTWVGQVRSCPGADCGLRLRLNAFVSRV